MPKGAKELNRAIVEHPGSASDLLAFAAAEASAMTPVNMSTAITHFVKRRSREENTGRLSEQDARNLATLVRAFQAACDDPDWDSGFGGQAVTNVAWAHAKLPRAFADADSASTPLPFIAHFLATCRVCVVRAHVRTPTFLGLRLSAFEAATLLWSFETGARSSLLNPQDANGAHGALVSALCRALVGEDADADSVSFKDVRMASTALAALLARQKRGTPWDANDVALIDALCARIGRVADAPLKLPVSLLYAGPLAASFAELAPLLRGSRMATHRHNVDAALCACMRLAADALKRSSDDADSKAMDGQVTQIAFAVARRLQLAEMDGDVEALPAVREETRRLIADVCARIAGDGAPRPQPRVAASVLWCCGRAEAPPKAREARVLLDALLGGDEREPLALLTATMALVALSELGWYSECHVAALDTAAVSALAREGTAENVSAVCAASHALARIGHANAGLPRATLEFLAASAMAPSADAAAIAQLSWSLAVCGGATDAPAAALAWLREGIARHADTTEPNAFSRNELSMIYQFDLSLRLDNAASTPTPANEAQPKQLLESLWRDGRARYAAYRAWASGNDEATAGVHISQLHASVLQSLREVCASAGGGGAGGGGLASARVVHEFAAPGASATGAGGRALVREERFAAGDARYEASTGFAIDAAILPSADATRFAYLLWQRRQSQDEDEGDGLTAGAADGEDALPWLPRNSWDLTPLAMEVDGPHHFVACPWDNSTRRQNGSTQLKRRLLAASGWAVASVPFYEWDVLATEPARASYLRQQLAAACNGNAWMLKPVPRAQLLRLEDEERARNAAAAVAAAKRHDPTASPPSAAAALALASAKRPGGARRALLKRVAVKRGGAGAEPAAGDDA